MRVAHYSGHVNEVAAVRLVNSKPAAMLHFFVRQSDENVRISDPNQKIPQYKSAEYEALFEGTKFHALGVVN